MMNIGPADIAVMITNSSTAPSSVLSDRVALPIPPAPYNELSPDERPDTRFEMEVYARFMRHLRNVPNSRMDVKILAAIEFTADLMDTSDALVSKILVDMGLRGPRRAFPHGFLDFADKVLQRRVWEQGMGTPAGITAIQAHWSKIGEDCFLATGPTH